MLYKADNVALKAFCLKPLRMIEFVMKGYVVGLLMGGFRQISRIGRSDSLRLHFVVRMRTSDIQHIV